MFALLQNGLYTHSRLFAGDRIHMRNHSGAVDDNGSGIDRLVDGPGMEAGPVRPLHRGRRTDATPLQYARSPGLLPSKG